jgi:hypothetical protein
VRRKTLGWVLFLVGLLLLSLAATPYSRTATVALMCVRLALLILVSILTLRERWKHREYPQGTPAPGKPDAGDRLLQRLRRWYYDDEQHRR